MRIRIQTEEIVLEADLNESDTGRAIAEALPIESRGSRWGEEVYFSIPVDHGPEDATSEVDVGDLGYWPPGKALAIFFGPTPMSAGERPVPASPVNPVGRVLGDVTALRSFPDGGMVRVEAGGGES
jgi:hypothetical protein